MPLKELSLSVSKCQGMNRTVYFLSISIFSIFIGSQITEGFLLVPYWKSLPSEAFYEYYSTFGPIIGRFYTILTIAAALIPILLSAYFWFKKSKALTYSLISSAFIIICIVLFYIYFRGANQQFYAAALDANQLKAALKTWENWHWLRVVFECLSLFFLCLSFNKASSAV